MVGEGGHPKRRLLWNGNRIMDQRFDSSRGEVRLQLGARVGAHDEQMVHMTGVALRHGNDSVVVRARLDTPELGRFLPVLSGNEGNVRRMREIMHEVNSQDPEVWLPVFMETAK